MMPDLRLDFAESYNQWEAYLNTFDINKSLAALPEPKSDKEKRFVAAKNIFTNYYNIKNLEIKLAKYTIYAPFSGVLTEANVNKGSLVSPGQSLGEFIDPSVYEMEVSVSSAMVSKIKVGDEIGVENLENANTKYNGKIIRINKKVDRSSQTVNVFIEMSGADLKEGMYLKAYLKSKVFENIVEIPRNLLVNQQQIYSVQDSVLHLKKIQLIHQNENTLIVSGLNDDETILIKPMPKAFEGMKVSIYKE
jgi:membrane fusion protein (multidrug efflux system)